MGAFIYLPPFSENSPIFRSFPFAKIQPVFLTEQTGAHEAPHPVFPVSHASRYNTLHFASKVVFQRGHPFGNPGQQNRRYATLSGSIPPFVVSSPFLGLFSPFVKFGVASFMGYLKGKSSLMLYEKFPEQK